MERWKSKQLLVPGGLGGTATKHEILELAIRAADDRLAQDIVAL